MNSKNCCSFPDMKKLLQNFTNNFIHIFNNFCGSILHHFKTLNAVGKYFIAENIMFSCFKVKKKIHIIQMYHMFIYIFFTLNILFIIYSKMLITLLHIFIYLSSHIFLISVKH